MVYKKGERTIVELGLGTTNIATNIGNTAIGFRSVTEAEVFEPDV